VILSTHIVSDVSDLCAQMAIIDKGRVLLTGRPSDLTRRLDARVWQKAIARADLAATKAMYPVISTRLVAGRTLVNVVSDAAPGEGFAPVAATLEDVYFAAIAGRLDTPAAALQPA
jgi:ABC-2 type transport system ATP-binding protein